MSTVSSSLIQGLEPQGILRIKISSKRWVTIHGQHRWENGTIRRSPVDFGPGDPIHTVDWADTKIWNRSTPWHRDVYRIKPPPLHNLLPKYLPEASRWKASTYMWVSEAKRHFSWPTPPSHPLSIYQALPLAGELLILLSWKLRQVAMVQNGKWGSQEHSLKLWTMKWIWKKSGGRSQ